MHQPMQRPPISILGAGKIGRAVGALWLRAGYPVCFGARSPESLAAFVESLGDRASATTVQEAALASDIHLLAVPYAAVDELSLSLRTALAGKIVIDATNPFALSTQGRIVSSLGDGLTAGSRMARLLPESLIVRAFSHVMDELLVSRASTQPGFWAMALAGDDAQAKRRVAQLVRDAGFVPVDIGSLAESVALDPGGKLFPHIYTEADMRAALA